MGSERRGGNPTPRRRRGGEGGSVGGLVNPLDWPSTHLIFAGDPFNFSSPAQVNLIFRHGLWASTIGRGNAT